MGKEMNDSKVNIESWRPHRPETWTHKYASLTRPVLMQYYTGSWDGRNPVMRDVQCPAGTRVRVVMVSRLGYLGITEDLNSDRNYGAAVYPDTLTDWSEERRGMNT